MPEKNYYELVYMSVASSRPSEKDLTALLVQCRKANCEKNITGILIYAEGHFMEFLEGSKAAVEQVMAGIKRDTRHHDVNVLLEGPVSELHFSDWSMAFSDFASPQIKAMPGYNTFLEGPPFLESENHSPSIRLLHYFKTIMTASDASMLNLSDAIEKKQQSDCEKTRRPGPSE